MARKDLRTIGKNIVASRDRPTSMDELLADSSQVENSEKTETLNYENAKKQNSEITEKQKLGRYETRLYEDLDIRFRRYMFEHKAKTNPTIIAALEEFLIRKGY